jgi:ABC-2 type transport system ATP-binding protein
MDNAILLEGVSRCYGRLTAVDELSLAVPCGEAVALLGSNGAGKTTLVSILTGLLAPDAGTVTVAGLSPRAAGLAGRVAAMPQDGGLMPGVTAGELVRLAHALYPAPMPVEEALELAGLTRLARRRTDRMSGGQSQRLRFALAAVADPDILLLDEPTRAMDVAGRREFWAAMRAFASRGRTIMFATHYLDEVEENADRVVVLARGRVVADCSPDRLRALTGHAVVSFRLPADERPPRLPGDVAVDADTVTVRTDDPDTVVRLLAASGAPWRDLRISPPSLDDSFLALTGGADPGGGAPAPTDTEEVPA